MRVGILGNYGHSNLGDEALLLGAINCARADAKLRSEEIVVLSDNKDDTDIRLQGLGCEIRQLRRPYDGRVIRLPMVILDIFRSLKGLDWLVFGGGGLLNDSNRTAIPMYALIRALAWVRGIRVAWWSVGIGPLESGLRERLASWLLSSSDFVSVRDEYSHLAASEMVTKSASLTPDLAHAIQGSVSEGKVRPATVAVSVVPYKKAGMWFEESNEQYSNYCDKMVTLINGLLDARPDIQVRLFPISLNQDSAAISDIMTLGEFGVDGRVDFYRPDSVQTLVTELGQAEVVIATRLHSVVLATLAGTPSITIAYQPKVASYANELQVGLPCFNIEEFCGEEVVDAVIAVLGNSASFRESLYLINDKRRSELRRAVVAWRELV